MPQVGDIVYVSGHKHCGRLTRIEMAPDVMNDQAVTMCYVEMSTGMTEVPLSRIGDAYRSDDTRVHDTRIRGPRVIPTDKEIRDELNNEPT